MATKSKTDKFATKYPGVYKKFSKTRRNPKDGKPDEGFVVAVRITEGGKYVKKWLYLGWKSEGMTVDKANDTLLSIKKQLKTGEPPENIFERAKSGEPVEIDSTTQSKRSKNLLTFGEAWKIYNEKWVDRLARPNEERGKYKNHIKPRFENVPLAQINSLDLETLKQEMSRDGLSAGTIKHSLALMSRVYHKMVAWEYYDGRMPTANVEMPKVDSARVRYLTQDEADMLMKALHDRNQFWWRIAMVSLHTGMRLGEVLALTRGDIDFQGGVIHVQHGKTGSRMVQMNETAEAVLKGAPTHPESLLVFPQQCGNPIFSTTASKVFSRVVKDLSLNPEGTPRSQKVVFHTLRHTFASWLVMAGVPLYTVSKLLGHSSLDMTYRYAHLAPDTQKEAVRLLASLADRQPGNGLKSPKAA